MQHWESDENFRFPIIPIFYVCVCFWLHRMYRNLRDFRMDILNSFI